MPYTRRKAAPNAAAYCASKGGLRMVTRCFALELAEPLVAVEAAELGVADRLRVLDEALAKAGAGLGRGERGGIVFMAPQALIERFRLGEESFNGFPSA